MINTYKKRRFLLILALLSVSPALAAEQTQHQADQTEQMNAQHHDDEFSHSEAGYDEAGHEEAGHNEEGGNIELSPEQIKQGGLKIITVQALPQAQVLQAPGLVGYNDYRMAEVSTLLDATVQSRHVRLGQHVAPGAKLITLKSITLAQAQADWIRAQANFNASNLAYLRLKPLAASGSVSQSRMQQATSDYEASKAQLRAASVMLSAYGLNAEDLRQLEQGKSFGLLTLRAAIAGTIVADNVVLGQHIAAGSRLMRIVDEATVWVEVNVSPEKLPDIKRGAVALVRINQADEGLPATVIGVHHELDTITRTAVVRLEVDNSGHQLHSGMFVDAQIHVGNGGLALLLAEQAVQRQGSERIVFVEEKAGHFVRREVDIKAAGMGQVEIRSGLKLGERVVVDGAFVLLSELLKSGFEAHNH